MEAAHGTHYTEILFTPNCIQRPGSFPFHFICKTHLWSAFLYDVHFWSYGCHSSLIFTFLPIFPIQNALFCARTTAHKLHCKMLPVIPYCSGRAKGVRNPQTFQNFCLCEMAVYIYTHYYTVRRSGPMRNRLETSFRTRMCFSGVWKMFP